MLKNRDWGKALLYAGIPFSPNKEEILTPCVLHSDTHPSLSINLKKGVWMCHAGCGSGRLDSLLSQYLDITLLEANRLAYTDYIEDLKLDFGDDEIDKYLPLSPIIFPFTKNKVPKWIFDRGFDSETMMKWGFGYDENEGSLVIPINDENHNLVGWAKRRPEGLFPKYLYGPKDIFKKSRVVFGADEAKTSRDFICITEGALDTVWLSQNGFNSVAILGVFLSKAQERIISSFNTGEIVLCLDNDNAGQLGIESISPRLSKYFVVSKIRIPDKYKDVQDIRDQKVLRLVLENRVFF